MNTIESNQKWVFFILFSIVALLINSTQGFGVTKPVIFAPVASSSPSPQPSQASLAAQHAAQAAAADHVKFLAKYLHGGFDRMAGSRRVAIMVSADGNSQSHTVATALARRFQGSSVQISTSFFTQAFTTDGLFDDILSGSREPFDKLDLSKSVDTLVLACENIQYSQNPSLENVITATIKLTVNVIPVSGSSSENLSWAFTASGPGFSDEVARQAAEDRLIKQIDNNTQMSLN